MGRLAPFEARDLVAQDRGPEDLDNRTDANVWGEPGVSWCPRKTSAAPRGFSTYVSITHC